MASFAPGRILDVSELKSLVGDLGAEEDRWRALIRHDPDQRIYEELMGDEHFAAYVISWMPGHDTGFHDHDDSSGAVLLLQGTLVEERLRVGTEPALRTFTAGATFGFEASDIHRVRHPGGEPAVSLHAYSPPLRRMGSYVVGPTGALRRMSLAAGQELRPLAAAGVA